MSKQGKNLSLNTLKKQNVQTYKDKKQIHFSNGSTLNVDVVFQPTKIENVVKEVMSVFDEVTKNKIGESLDADAWIVITLSSIIKNFTSLETDATGLQGLIELATILKDAEYFDQIVQSFDENELEKAFKKINDVMDDLNKQIDLIKAKNIVTENNNEELDIETSEEIGE